MEERPVCGVIETQKLMRDNTGYDPRNSRESPWFKYYVGEQSELYMDPATRRGKKFRRRYRMPKKNFRKTMASIREGNWFPTYKIKNALGFR